MAKYRSIESYIDEFVRYPQNERMLAESNIGLGLTREFTRLRKLAGLSQTELATRVGRKQPYIAKLESGAYDRCSVPTLRTFARALGFDIDVESMFRKIDQSIFSGDVGVDASLDAELTRDDGESIDEFLNDLRTHFAQSMNAIPSVTVTVPCGDEPKVSAA